MGWAKGTVIVAGVLTATAALPCVVSGSSRTLSNPAASGIVENQRVIVTPQNQIFEGDRAQLGVTLRDLDEALAKEHRLTATEGALVDGVEPGSAAEKAGMKPGDVIVAFDGERVRSVRQLQRLVTDTPPDRAVRITVVRDGRKTDVTATLAKASGGAMWPGGDEMRLGEWEGDLANRLRDLPRTFRYEWHDDQAPGDIVPRTPRPPSTPEPRMSPFDRLPGLPRFPFNGWTSGGERLGVVVQELTPQLGEYFGSKEGVLVASVTEGSPAARAGIKAGDVITAVNGKTVTDVEALLRAVRGQPDGEEMTVGFLRDHKPQTVKVKLLNATRARPI